MKKLLILVLAMLLLCGCAAQETFETLGNIEQSVQQTQPWQILCDIPLEAGQPAIQSQETGTLYFCDQYTMILQTLEGGDLNKTFLQCTGYAKDSLQVIATESQNVKRYDAAWTSAAEDGDRVGRIAVLDDGNYHYVMTVEADASLAGQLQETWQGLFRSMRIADPQTVVSTGS